MNINGEAIYGTTPWRISKEGPTRVNMEDTEHREKHGFQANFTEKDFWYTRKDYGVYAISFKWLKNNVAQINALNSEEIESAELLGYNKKIKWIKPKIELRMIFKGKG